LAESCLRLMSRCLRQNICDLKVPGTFISEVDPDLIEDKLSPALQYACCYWADHYCSAEHIITVDFCLEAFLENHLLQ
jgi:hypothetical protein